MTDFRTLKDFVVLARIRSFSQAADHCNVTTSGLSRRIKALEEWLGTPVFDRSHHHLQLTDAGAEFHATAVQVIALLDKTRRGLGRRQEQTKLQISIAAPPIMSRVFFPAWFSSLRNQSAQMHFSIEFDSSPGCFQCLLDRSVDFIVAFSDTNDGIRGHLEKTFPLQDLEYLKLGKEWLVPVSAPNLLGDPLNSITSQRGEVSYLHYRQDCSLSWALEKMLDANTDLPSLIKVHASSLTDGLYSMAAIGLGVAWLPLEMVFDDLERKKLVRAGGREHDIALEIYLVRRKESLGINAEILWANLHERMNEAVANGARLLSSP
jgi:DNA-binding transcriptional LysR family regulator